MIAPTYAMSPVSALAAAYTDSSGWFPPCTATMQLSLKSLTAAAAFAACLWEGSLQSWLWRHRLPSLQLLCAVSQSAAAAAGAAYVALLQPAVSLWQH
jgi:hypothetical protein